MVYYYILNEHGDVAQLWGQSGTRKALYEYDAFGNERNPEKGDENPFRYCGEYLDLEMNTYYLRNRYYSPTTGRFLTEDTIRDGLNWYTYCANNPIMFIDPFGLALLRQYVEDNKGTVTWDEKTRTATAAVNGITRSFTAGSYGIFISKNGCMYVPDDILETAFTKASQVIVNNKSNITSSAQSTGVNAQTLAAIIYTEQHYNVNARDIIDYTAHMVTGVDTSLGIAQVRVSTAAFIEDQGYMPKTKGTLRLNRFQVIATMLNSNDSVSINYAAAYLAYFQDTWAGAYPNITNDLGVLGTLYNNGPYVPGINILTPPILIRNPLWNLVFLYSNIIIQWLTCPEYK